MPELSYLAALGLTRAAAGRLPSRATLKRSLLSVAALAALGFAGDGGYDYWKVGRFQQSIDDAYLRADFVTVTPWLSGHIVEVLVRDNEPVQAGQVLALLHDRDHRSALDQALADVATADATFANLDAQIAQQESVLDQERAEIAHDKASVAYAKSDNQRYEELRKAGYGSVQRAQQAETAMRQDMAHLRKSRAALVSGERRIDVLVSERKRAAALRERSLAAQHEAEGKLSHAAIVAPISGTVGALSLRVGQYVRAGTPLMAVVPLDAVYVVANYKETQLAAVQPGQPVTVEVDAFPGQPITGHVESLAPASGREFSLLPADNATGNFTKIVQRVPVKIALDETTLIGRLRPGMSARTTIDTRSK
jgi:membrane fusion protein (multidrug efflux system)